MRTVDLVVAPPPVHWVGDGFRVHNFFPSNPQIGFAGLSPFLMMDYNSLVDFSPREQPRGVGPHPHRGFETVTIAYHGKVAHHDNAGNSGVIEEGDVQWMTAGSGLLHKEYHEKEFSRKGGPFQMVQLWVNLPARSKMTPPKYQALTKSMMGKVMLPNDTGYFDIISGELQGVKGPAFTFSPVHLFNGFLQPGASVELSFPAHFNAGVLVLKGSVTINNQTSVPLNHLARLKNDGETFTIGTSESSTILILAGEPIQEPIASYGPFVMNTREEIEQAILDFNSGKFGDLD